MGLQSVERVVALVDLAKETLDNAIEAITEGKKGWEKMKLAYAGVEGIITKIDSLIKAGNIVDKLKTAGEVVQDVKKVKDTAVEIWEIAKELKDKVLEIRDNLKQLRNDLSQWEKFKKEIEGDFVNLKLEILRAVASAKKTALSIKAEAAAGLVKLEATLGTQMTLTGMTESVKAFLLKEFHTAMTEYPMIAWGEKQGDLKELQKNIAKTVSQSLEKLLTGAVSYATESAAWAKLKEYEGTINNTYRLIQEFMGNTDTEEISLTGALTQKVEEWTNKVTEWAGDKVNQVLGPLVQIAGPAFDYFKKFAEVYGIVRNFPEALEKKLPYKYNKELYSNKWEIFKYGFNMPVASMAWITLNITFDLEANAEVKVEANITIHNIFDAKEVKIVDGDITVNGGVSLSGAIGMSIDICMIVEIAAKARLTAALNLVDLKAGLELTRNSANQAKKGGLRLSAEGKLEFSVKGSLEFSIGLTPGLKKLIKWVSGYEAEKKWVLGEMELFKATTSKKVSAMLEMNIKNVDLKELIEALKDRTIYRLEKAGRDAIEQSLAGKVGNRKNWEEKMKGEKLTEDEITELATKYGKAA